MGRRYHRNIVEEVRKSMPINMNSDNEFKTPRIDGHSRYQSQYDISAM